MTRTVATGLTIFLAVLAGACGAVPIDAVDGLALTWERAYLYLPERLGGVAVAVGGRRAGGAVAAAEAAIGPGTRLPSVLFVHGCGGFGNSGRVIARLLATAGYAVFAPDSFARPGRPETCDSRSRRSIVPGAVLDRVYAMRAAEIGYGRARLAEIPWVDRDNLFLVGHSQGGTAAAAHPGGGFKARVIGGSACKRGYGAAPGAPALAVTSRHDPWLKRDGSRCDRYAVGSALEVVELSGDAHVAAEVPEGRRAILAFLARHTEARRP